MAVTQKSTVFVILIKIFKKHWARWTFLKNSIIDKNLIFLILVTCNRPWQFWESLFMRTATLRKLTIIINWCDMHAATGMQYWKCNNICKKSWKPDVYLLILLCYLRTLFSPKLSWSPPPTKLTGLQN